MKKFAVASLFALCLVSPPFASVAFAETATQDLKQIEAGLRDTRAKAESGDAEAQHKLGVMYLTGQGVAKDDAQALTWVARAADQSNADAQTTLGFMYAEGRGVTKDFGFRPGVALVPQGRRPGEFASPVQPRRHVPRRPGC